MPMGGSPENTAPHLIEKSLFVLGSVVVGTRTGRSNCVHDHLEKRRRPDVTALLNRTWSPIVWNQRVEIGTGPKKLCHRDPGTPVAIDDSVLCARETPGCLISKTSSKRVRRILGERFGGAYVLALVARAAVLARRKHLGKCGITMNGDIET